MTEAGPLVVLVGDGHLPDDLERAVASRATAERGVLGPTLDAGLAGLAGRRCASWPGPVTPVRWPWSTRGR